MGEESVVKKVTQWKPDFKRARGRPKNRWEEHVLEDRESAIEGGRSRIGSHGRESQKRQRQVRD